MRLATSGVLAAIVTIVFAFSTNAQSPATAPATGDIQNQILGDWEAKETVANAEVKIVLHFQKDILKVSFDTVHVEGTWKVTGKDTIQVTITGPDAKTLTEETKVVINNNVMTLTGQDQKETKFTKVLAK
jgi:hypothetical protein